MIILCTWSTIVNVERSNEQLGLRWPQWGISFNTSFQAFLYPSSKTSKPHTSSTTRYRFVKVNGVLRCRIHMNCSLAISNSRKSTLDGMLLIKFHLTTLYDHSLDKGIPHLQTCSASTEYELYRIWNTHKVRMSFRSNMLSRAVVSSSIFWRIFHKEVPLVVTMVVKE